MFGRRRHAAQVAQVPAPVPQLDENQILRLVEDKLSAVIGVDGQWSVTPRSSNDTDSIFHGILTKSIAATITSAIMDARARLVAGDSLEELTTASAPSIARAAEAPAHVAPRALEPVLEEAELPALTWEPAPITKWADLRRPVTGEIAVVAQQHAA